MIQINFIIRKKYMLRNIYEKKKLKLNIIIELF